jgi:hypothetical protein
MTVFPLGFVPTVVDAEGDALFVFSDATAPPRVGIPVPGVAAIAIRDEADGYLAAVILRTRGDVLAVIGALSLALNVHDLATDPPEEGTTGS